MKLLKELYKIYSPSGKERRMIRFIANYIKRNIPEAMVEVDKIGNIYITKGLSETYPSLVAHLDQVQDLHSKDFKAIETSDIIFGYSAKNRRQEGLGADDKNGIWIALKCLQLYDAIKVAFFVQEEIGCIGSSHAKMEFFDDCRFVIGCDRKGNSDIITNINWTTLCSEEFLTNCGAERFGYAEQSGFITDVGELKQNGLSVSCINLSCGYYEPHTDHEITVKSDLLNCLEFVKYIIENCTEVYPHTDYDDFQYMGYGTEQEELEYLAEDMLIYNPKLTAQEFYDMYGMHYPHLDIAVFQQIIEDRKLELSMTKLQKSRHR
ncbi:MAG: hypothetical protein R3Y65_09350 [Bacillota bacterium]